MASDNKLADLEERLLRLLNNPSDKVAVEEKAGEMGLTKIWAYHCKRCNYVWLPKDFDMSFTINRFHPDQKNLGEDLLFKEPPKSCARCKSKYWNSYPNRRSRYSDGIDHSRQTIARLRAKHRQGKLGFAIDGCDCKYCTKLRVV